MTGLGKIPPQAIELEEAVLGALMLEKGVIDEIRGILLAEDFYKTIHQVIYKTILDLDRNDRPIDILTVTEELKRIGKLEEVGGPLYITQLSGKVATADHIAGHAQLIKDKSLQRKFISMGHSILKAAHDDPEDLEEMIALAGNQLEEIIDSAYGPSFSAEFRYLLNSSLREAEEREKLAKKGKVPGIRTPLADLTRVTAGFQPGELVILAGRPSMGKTAFALAAAKTAAQENKHVLIFSLEMKGERLTDRLLIGETDLDPERFKNGQLNEMDWQRLEKALGSMQDFGIFIFDDPSINVDYIRAKSRILKKKSQCDLVIVDYLQLIESKSKKNQNREQEVAEISRRMKLLAMELGVPVILLSQLNRSCEARADKRPLISDLRESGAIEQDADLIIFLYRHEVYATAENGEANPFKGMGELILAKNRNGRIGVTDFRYNDSLTKIYDVPRAGDLEPVKSSEKQTDMPF